MGQTRERFIEVCFVGKRGRVALRDGALMRAAHLLVEKTPIDDIDTHLRVASPFEKIRECPTSAREPQRADASRIARQQLLHTVNAVDEIVAVLVAHRRLSLRRRSFLSRPLRRFGNVRSILRASGFTSASTTSSLSPNVKRCP